MILQSETWACLSAIRSRYCTPNRCSGYWLQGLWFNKSAEGGNNDGKADPPRASNASKHERPSEIPVVTAALGFVSTFGDVYRLWAFVAKFLDADFVKREEWLYHSLNQEIHVL